MINKIFIVTRKGFYGHPTARKAIVTVKCGMKKVLKFHNWNGIQEAYYDE